MNKWMLVVLFLGFLNSLLAQPENYGFLVEFTDKNHSPYSTANPEAFLSERAIQRRAKSNIEITEVDLPISQYYVDSLLSLNARLHNVSKWLNSAVYLTNNPDFRIEAFRSSFVKNVTLIYEGNNKKSIISANKFGSLVEDEPADFWGAAFHQLDRCRVIFLHQKGYKGQGIQVAVLDGGFYNVNSISGFDSLMLNQQILGTYDYVDKNGQVYEDHEHGMMVLSVMGGNIPNQYLGSGPKASFWLLRTENVFSEYPIEEENWIAAAEFADSAGVDIITSSLGYGEFDNPEMNHTINQLDGYTIRVSRAADLAFDRGMLVINSAGNSGSLPWYYITAPSDGKNVICVGAIDAMDNLATFSSRGPSADGRVKPDVVAQGVKTSLFNKYGNISEANGTSFSCPLVTGMAASLWSAFPDKTNRDIYSAIQYCSSNYFTSNEGFGYGIPDFEKAYYRLLQNNVSDVGDKMQVSFPNPFRNEFHVNIQNIGNTDVVVELYSFTGAKVYGETFTLPGSYFHRIQIDRIARLNRGVYFLSVSNGTSKQTQTLVKL
ncbi:MAG: S8 family serine peptidase [Salinivirgaceae bacterium]